MKLNIRNKWISLAGSSIITDENEQEVFKVKGKFFTLTNKKFFYDMNDKLLFMIRRRFLNFFVYKAYVFDANMNKVCTVRRKFFSLHDHYYIKDSTKGNFEIRGNILQFNYDITREGELIGHVSRKISVRDSFELEIPDAYKDEAAFFSSLVIAIDIVTDTRDNDRCYKEVK